MCVATVAVFGQIRGHEFIDYDDNLYITGNPHLSKGLSAEGLRWAFTEPFGEYWIPLTYVSWLAEYEFSGIDPSVHHVDNLLLHLVSTLLLFGFLVRTTGALWCSGFVALVFAIHPLHVESVAWATERRDTLAGLFWMLGLVAYALYTERPTAARFAWVALCLVLGLLSKPLLVTFPFVLLLLDFWPLGRLSGDSGHALDSTRLRRAVLEKLILLPFVLVTSAVAFEVQRTAGAMTDVQGLSLGLRVGNALVSYATYLVDAFWPVGLAVFYPHPAESVGIALPAAIGMGLLLITVIAVRQARRRPYLLVGWLWYLGTLVPMLGLVQVGIQARADRYTYIPLIGIALAVAWTSVDLLGATRRGRRALAAVAGLAGLALCVVAWRQTTLWRDTITLFRHTVAVTERNPIAHRTLGFALTQAGQIDEAVDHLRMAVRIEPGWGEAARLYAVALNQAERTEEAILYYRKAIRLDPGDSRSRAELARLLAQRGQRLEAIDLYRAALRMGAGRDEAAFHAQLGELLDRGGDTAAAVRHYREALRVDPGFQGVHERLTRAQARLAREGGG